MKESKKAKEVEERGLRESESEREGREKEREKERERKREKREKRVAPSERIKVREVKIKR